MPSEAVHDETPRILAPYVRVGVQDATLFLGFGSIRRPVHDRALWEPLLRLADHFLEPRTRSEASEHLHAHHGVDATTVEAAMLLLEDGNCLIPTRAFDRADRYSRHALFYELSGSDAGRVQRRLGTSHVVLLGCGGIGGLLAVTLATAGVGALTLVDGDHVELSNLTRQFLFTERDIGLPKAEVLSREVGRRNPACAVRPVVHDVAGPADVERLPEGDVLVVSADSPGLTKMVNAHCVASGTTWLNACYVNDIAVWGPLVIPGVTGCWDCRTLTARPPENDNSSDVAALIERVNGRYQAPSNGPVNMLASSLAALDVLRHLGGFGTPASLDRRVGVWSHELALDHQSARRDPACGTCAGSVPSPQSEGTR